MVSQISAKAVKKIMKTEATNASSGPTGACMVMRYQPGTTVSCHEMTKAACDQVDRNLGNDGHAKFLGNGTRCL